MMTGVAGAMDTSTQFLYQSKGVWSFTRGRSEIGLILEIMAISTATHLGLYYVFSLSFLILEVF